MKTNRYSESSFLWQPCSSWLSPETIGMDEGEKNMASVRFAWSWTLGSQNSFSIVTVLSGEGELALLGYKPGFQLVELRTSGDPCGADVKI